MNKPNLYILGLAFLFFCGLAIWSFRNNPVVKPEVNYQDSLNLVVKTHKTDSVKFKQKEDSLIKVIANISKSLSFQKSKYNSIKDTALSLIKKAPKECQELALITDSLIQEGIYKDSLFEAKITTQDSLISTKGKRIVECDKSFVLLQGLSQNVINLNLGLQSENSKLQKKVSNKNKLIAGLGSALVLIGTLFVLK